MAPQLTSSQIIEASQTPTFDVLISGHGDILVQVTGVKAPFEFQVSRRTLVDDAPFGKPTPASIMRTAQYLAQYECVKRRLV